MRGNEDKSNERFWLFTTVVLCIMLLSLFYIIIYNKDILVTVGTKELALSVIPNILSTLIIVMLSYFYLKNKLSTKNKTTCRFQKTLSCKYTDNDFKLSSNLPSNADINSSIDFIFNDKNNKLDYLLFCKNYSNKDYYHRTRDDIKDRFEHFKIDSNRDDQEEIYTNIAEYIHDMVDSLNNNKKSMFKDLNQDVLFRVVYDVEKGGVFYYHIRDGVYLFGATLDQEDMDNNSADMQFRFIANHVEKLISH